MAEVEKKEPVKKPPVKLRGIYDDVEFLKRELKNLRDYVSRIEDKNLKEKPAFLKEIEELEVVPVIRRRKKRTVKEVDPVMEAVKKGLKEVDEESTEDLGSFAEYAEEEDEDSAGTERALIEHERHSGATQDKPKRRGRPKGSKNKLKEYGSFHESEVTGVKRVK